MPPGRKKVTRLATGGGTAAELADVGYAGTPTVISPYHCAMSDLVDTVSRPHRQS